jgi:drug/metabolite transporter (DMT)-like permease
VFAPVAALTWELEASAWPYLAGSVALEIAYLALLATAYARADLTFVYPIARGSAPVFALVVSVTLLGAALGGWQIAGVLAVAAGILLVRGVRGGGEARDLLLALAVGACVAGYTLVDHGGLEHGSPIAYFELVAVLTAIPYLSFLAARGGTAPLRRAANARTLLVGVAMFGGYALALAALERAEAAPVAALRETSVVMAAIAAVALRRERAGAARLAGAAAVVAGAAAIALG